MSHRTLHLVNAVVVCLLFATPLAADDLAFPTSPAPAASPTFALDSLPEGRHEMSSYRNGSSTKVVVENRQIVSLEIDGRTIPAEKYDQYVPMVERMMGTNKKAGTATPSHPLEWMNEDQLGIRLEDYENRFENLGQRWEDLGGIIERMAESFGESFESMFDVESGSHTYRFDFRGNGDGGYYLDLDSLPPGTNFDFRHDELSPKGTQVEDEIREMETMIEQLERRKAEMKRQLDEEGRQLDNQQRDSEQIARDLARQVERNAERIAQDAERIAEEATRHAADTGAAIDRIIDQLEDEALIEAPGEVNRLKVDNKKLIINGKRASEKARLRFLELYERQTGSKLGKQFSVEINR